MGEPLDILVLSHLVPWPPTSGALLRSYHLLKEVARRHRVYLYAFNQEVLLGGDAVADSISHLQSFCAEVRVFPLGGAGAGRRPAAARLATGARLLRNLLSPLPDAVPRFASADYERAVIDLLGRRPIRLLEFATIAMAPYGALAPDLPGILVHHNVESDLLARRAARARNPLVRLYLAEQARRLERFEDAICPRQGANVAVSDADRARFERRIPRARFEVVVNGVDVEAFRPPADPAGGDSEVVFVGGMSWFPNRDGMAWFLAEVWPLVRARRPRARLIVVGSHPAPEVRAAAAAGDGVVATGLVPDVRPYLEAAGVVVCPLRVGGGTRLKILDAWAMGKAVVSTGVGCEGLGAASGRELEIADTAAEFAARVDALLGDRERRLRLGRAGRARAVEHFAWPQVAAGMLRLYDELAADHAGVAS